MVCHYVCTSLILVAKLNGLLSCTGGAAAPVGWMLAAEMPSNTLRSATFPLAMAVSNFVNWIVVSSFLESYSRGSEFCICRT